MIVPPLRLASRSCNGNLLQHDPRLIAAKPQSRLLQQLVEDRCRRNSSLSPPGRAGLSNQRSCSPVSPQRSFVTCSTGDPSLGSQGASPHWSFATCSTSDRSSLGSQGGASPHRSIATCSTSDRSSLGSQGGASPHRSLATCSTSDRSSLGSQRSSLGGAQHGRLSSPPPRLTTNVGKDSRSKSQPRLSGTTQNGRFPTPPQQSPTTMGRNSRSKSQSGLSSTCTHNAPAPVQHLSSVSAKPCRSLSPPERRFQPPVVQSPRLDLVRSVFQLCDLDGDGLLSEVEMRQFALYTGFDGDAAEWAEGFAALRSTWLGGAAAVNFQVFRRLLDDRSENGWYCSNKHLREVVSAMSVKKDEQNKVKAPPSLNTVAAEPESELPTPSMAAEAPKLERSWSMILEHEALLKDVRLALAHATTLLDGPLDVLSLTAATERLSYALLVAKTRGVPEGQLSDFERHRRRLHNTLQDLKGAIRVFCRIRPLSKREYALNDTSAVACLDDMAMQVEGPRGKRIFHFDAVFAPGTQSDIFAECAHLVQSALDGYNVALLAYGQTGAGKTFTIHGTPEEPGLAWRTVQEVYRLSALDSRCECTVTGSMVEVYNQDFLDLLAPSGTHTGTSGSTNRLKLRHAQNGTVLLEGLTEVTCGNATLLLQLLERGTSARRVAPTLLNDQSSRSHLLFTIKVSRHNRETGETLRGKLLLVDLAGSERQRKSMAVGSKGAREAIGINKSLTALADVIEALANGSPQVPYRNHPLTLLLQDALGGNAKTLMFVNCSPGLSSVEETINSLKWAQRTKSIMPEARSGPSSPAHSFNTMKRFKMM